MVVIRKLLAAVLKQSRTPSARSIVLVPAGRSITSKFAFMM
ncbi:MAG: hypothetical protein ACJ75R_03880 [Solirubrobacterales bacterium]